MKTMFVACLRVYNNTFNCRVYCAADYLGLSFKEAQKKGC